MRLLFVCLGNICRSPTAEAVFRARAPAGITVDSCGTGDWHVGAPPYGPMQAAARARGYDLSRLRARQLAPSDFRDFTLILAMDRANLRDIRAVSPRDATAEIRLFLDHAPHLGRDVPDPYHTRDFDGALTLIEDATASLIDTLAPR